MHKRRLESLWREALAHHTDHRPSEAEASYRQILDQHPSHAGALGMLAMVLADGTNDVEAETAILRHLVQSPDDGGSLLLLGQLRARQGNDEAAVALFQRAAHKLPHLAPIYNDLGMALYRLKYCKEAVAALDYAIELDPRYSVAHSNRKVMLFRILPSSETAVPPLAVVTH